MKNVWLAHHGIVGMKWGVRKDKRNTLQKKKNGGRLNLDLQFFAKRRSKDRPYKYKTPEEYNRLHNAISQLSNEDKQKDTLYLKVEMTDSKGRKVNRGAYTYFLKNQDGHGTFQPYGRKKIKDSSTILYEREPNNE